MTNEEASIIVGNIPINGDECYTIPEYQQAKAMAIKALETVSCIKEKCAYCPHCENCDVDDETLEIKALEQQEKTVAITRYIDGLEEGIRCAMCTNPMANDRGCDGGCVVNESMYQNVLNVIKKQILEQQPCEDCISRHDALNCVTFNEVRYRMVEDIKALPSVTPKEKTGKWIYKQSIFGVVYCSECDFELKINNTKYCPNCGARMVSE